MWFYIHISVWCPRPDSNWHSINGKDFKSFVSTDFTTRACVVVIEVLVFVIHIINPEFSQLQVYYQVYLICSDILRLISKICLYSFSRNQKLLRALVAPSILRISGSCFNRVISLDIKIASIY